MRDGLIPVITSAITAAALVTGCATREEPEVLPAPAAPAPAEADAPPEAAAAPEAPDAETGFAVSIPAPRVERYPDAKPPTLPPRLAEDRPLRQIPYEGRMMEERVRGPLAYAPPPQKRLDPWVVSALESIYLRPAPPGPPAIPRAVPKALYVEGRSPVVQVLPGPTVFADHLPEIAKTALPPKTPFSNHVVTLPQGDVRFAAFDYTHNDSRLSRDSMAFEATFTDRNGDEWRIVQVMLAPLSPSPVSEPWFGGLVIDTLYHGETGNGTPAEPLVNCKLCSWGWADIYRNGKRVDSAAPLHVMLTSDVRDNSRDFAYACYDCTANPIREVHIIIPPRAGLETPGGFLHLMWENAEWREGSPEQIAATAPDIGLQTLPVIDLAAVPYLNWSDEEIRVLAGQEYMIRLTNEDPADYHSFSIHDVGISVPLPHGSDWGTVVKFDKPGEYHFMCGIDNHRNRGMRGKFIVECPPGQTCPERHQPMHGHHHSECPPGQTCPKGGKPYGHEHEGR